MMTSRMLGSLCLLIFLFHIHSALPDSINNKNYALLNLCCLGGMAHLSTD